MNAGAFGKETWEYIESVETIDRKGEIRERTPQEYEVNYRSVESKQEEWFIGATFNLTRNEKVNISQTKKMLNKRGKTQPIGLRSCGSVFRNPENSFAAKLIDEAGLKGLRIGDAEVSKKHANFIINLGSAKASDIEELIFRIKEKVKDKFGIELELEVKIIGQHHINT